eukprot:2114905-Amphidinium_carterae.1
MPLPPEGAGALTWLTFCTSMCRGVPAGAVLSAWQACVCLARRYGAYCQRTREIGALRACETSPSTVSSSLPR